MTKKSSPSGNLFTPDTEITKPPRSSQLGTIISGALAGIIASTLVIYGALPRLVQSPAPTISTPPVVEEGIAETITIKPTAPDTIARSQKSLVYFYRANKNTILTADDLLGIGVAVTSDGWVATSEELFANAPSDLLAITYGAQGAITQKITDPFSHITFIKINRTDLQVIPFASTIAVRGSVVTEFDRSNILTIGFLTETHRHLASAPTSSETLDGVTVTSPEPSAGTILFTADGSLLGITGKKGLTTPGRTIKDTMQPLLKKGSFARSKLGVYFIDLGAVVVRDNKTLPTSGALISKKGTTPAVTKKSAADIGDIKEGDVITMIDSIELNADHSLPEALMLYSPGTTIPVTIWRAGTTRQINVTLQ